MANEDMRAALAAKGYDIVESPGGGSDSDDDLDVLTGRITSLEPNLAREKGKKAFEAGKYDKAIKAWQGGLKSILSTLCSGPEAMSNVGLSELDLTLNLNIAMAHMKKGDYDSADRSVDKALGRRDALPPHLITKALYRKASAQRAMRRLDECLATLKDLLGVEEKHAAGLQMQQEVDREVKKQLREQKDNLKKVFSKMGDQDKKMEERRIQKRAQARQQSGVRWLTADESDDVDSAAFDRGDAPGCDGKDWGLALNRTFLWAMEQFAVEERPCSSASTDRVSMWFLGTSSTCELRWLQPHTIMKRLPAVRKLELAMVGFLGELDPENKRLPDARADSLPKAWVHTDTGDGRCVSLRAFHGTLQEALDQNCWRDKDAAVPAVAASNDEAVAVDASVAAAAEAPVAEADVSTAMASSKASSTGGGYNSESPPEAVAESATVDATEAPSADAEAPAVEAASAADEVEPPTICFIAHPQLHRYFSDFFPAIAWLIRNNVPTVLIGASEPDHSWRQDEILLKALGANIVVGKRLSPYPMCLPDDDKIRKCNHIIGFQGGKPLSKEKLIKIKLELLSQDYSVR